ncbi:hypothetical protein GCM10027073_13760 [Streptomyces chlorus]|uniref:Uncharacterized protein n=1 Tax=Streptomyces chlorus TaxID=887452 RepID=A0ABW1DP92_9ACTN
MTAPGSTGRIGVAVASGMLKGVYGHGVLAAFEERGLRAQVYGTASSSALSGGLAAVGRARRTGVAYWTGAAAAAADKGMSGVVLDSIAEYGPTLREGLFRPEAPEFLLAAGKVTDPAAAEATQGPDAKALGRRLLRNVFAGDRSWVDEHLATVVFSSRAGSGGRSASWHRTTTTPCPMPRHACCTRGPYRRRSTGRHTSMPHTPAPARHGRSRPRV